MKKAENEICNLHKCDVFFLCIPTKIGNNITNVEKSIDFFLRL